MTGGLVRLGEVVEFINGGAWNQSEYVEEGIPVVRVTNMRDGAIDMSDCKFLPSEALTRYEKHQLRTGDLIIATVGSHPSQPGSVVGRPTIAREAVQGYLLNQNAVILRAMTDRIDQGWLGCLGRTADFREYIISCARGSANQVRMAIGLLKEMPVWLPPLTHQINAGSIISVYDDLIEVNHRRIAILEDMARRLFDEWFVRFRYAGHEAIPLVETELGAVPEGWTPVRLGSLLTLSYGKALKADQRRAGPVPVFGSSGIVGEHDQHLVQGPGIIVGRKGNVGSVHWSSHDFYPIDTVFFVETNMPLRWVYQLLKRQTFLNSDAAVPGLNREQAYAMKVLRPGPEVVGRYSQLVEPLFQQLELLTVQNSKLRAARDLLLPKLISGEIDVSASEETFAEAAE